MNRTMQNAALAAGAYEIPAIYAEGAGSRAVLMAHGLMGDKNEYKDTLALLADRLEAAGTASLRIDFCGHGDSSRPIGLITASFILKNPPRLIDFPSFRRDANFPIIFFGCCYLSWRKGVF